MNPRHFAFALVAGLCACTTSLDALSDLEPVERPGAVPSPEPTESTAYSEEDVDQGRYMVELLGCGACHTDGALVGAPNPARLLAGSSIGLAHSSPLQVNNPAVVFPPNLTSDPETGVANLSDAQLSLAIRHGVGRQGVALIGMPTAALARLRESDVNSIIAYLRSLPPVVHAVPEAVKEGQKTDKFYVHFGVYQSRRDP